MVSLAGSIAAELDAIDERARFCLLDTMRKPRRPWGNGHRACVSLSMESNDWYRLKAMADDVSAELSEKYGYEVRVGIGTIISWLMHERLPSPRKRARKRKR